MLNYQNFRLYDSYDEAISHAIVLNKRDLIDLFSFEIPHLLSKGLSLVNVRESDSDVMIDSSNITDKSPLPWIDILSSAMNQEIGAHTYTFKFIDSIVGSDVNLFAAYIIRYNDPEKPYIYMNRSEESS